MPRLKNVVNNTVPITGRKLAPGEEITVAELGPWEIFAINQGFLVDLDNPTGSPAMSEYFRVPVDAPAGSVPVKQADGSWSVAEAVVAPDVPTTFAQTYATPSTNLTAVSAVKRANAPTLYDAAYVNQLRDSISALIDDLVNTKQVLNAVTDELQARSIIG